MPDLCCYYTSIYTSIDIFIYYYINILLNYNIRTLSGQQLDPLRRGPLYTLHPFSYGPGERVLRSFRLTGQRFVLLSALLVHPPPLHHFHPEPSCCCCWRPFDLLFLTFCASSGLISYLGSAQVVPNNNSNNNNNRTRYVLFITDL